MNESIEKLWLKMTKVFAYRFYHCNGFFHLIINKLNRFQQTNKQKILVYQLSFGNNYNNP